MSLLPLSSAMPIPSQTVEAAAIPRNSEFALKKNQQADEKELRQAFDSFVGQTFFSQMVKAMRTTVGEPAYFHGGRAEEIFQSQLDQLLVDEISAASAQQFSDPMFELFNMARG